LLTYVDTRAEFALNEFSEVFYGYLSSKRQKDSEICMLCIGTDRATGDSLGPITGHKLISSVNSNNVSIYGTLEKPVHAKNINQTMDYINASYENPYITAIDACLGKPESVGFITIGEGPVNPGAGLSKALPTVGNISITGIVNVATGMDFSVLQNTRLHVVMKMAEVIYAGILTVLGNCQTDYGRIDKFIV